MTRTVFVVGAGASIEFAGGGSMPIGSQLAVQIEELIDNDLRTHNTGGSGPVSSAIMQSGGMNNSHLQAMQRIRQGIQSKNSIDDFIDEWSDVPELPRISKICIAECILRAEATSTLSQFGQDSNVNAQVLRSLRESWLGIVVRRVNPDARRRDVANTFDGVSFVTFNYDRCIEVFLYNYLVSTLGLGEADAAAALKNIPIRHVYGSLGNIKPLDPSGTIFGGAGLANWASKGIKTYTEELGTQELTDIQHELRMADRIIILGCAYHSQNMKILFNGGPPPNAKVFGTVHRMPERRIAAVRQYFDSRDVQRSFNHGGCAEMLTEWDELIFEDDE